jgi:mono/diheme cytochrome c family protein
MLVPRLRKTVLWCALVGFAPSLCAAQQKPARHSKPHLATGAELYKHHCAVCHANDGKGNGPPPANSPFREAPPDLTTLGRRHEGKFPDAYVTSVLRNGVTLPDHGPAEMPIWGTLFKATSNADEAQVSELIASLTGYLKSIQVK